MATNFDELVGVVEGKSGWRMDFASLTERNLGQAALLGDILSFTTYDPSDNPCTIEGYSSLYALYFKTGTAWYESVVGLGSTDSDGNREVKKIVPLGLGLTITPNIHTGRGEGSKAFVQTSTGAIVGIKEANPGATKSGIVYWMERMGK